MNDARAEAACNAYGELIRTHFNPSIAPELTKILNDLFQAYLYLQAIPVDSITWNQSRLKTMVKSILQFD